MNEHPDEVYNVVAVKVVGDETQYQLSEVMGTNSWYAEELFMSRRRRAFLRSSKK